MSNTILRNISHPNAVMIFTSFLFDFSFSFAIETGLPKNVMILECVCLFIEWTDWILFAAILQISDGEHHYARRVYSIFWVLLLVNLDFLFVVIWKLSIQFVFFMKPAIWIFRNKFIFTTARCLVKVTHVQFRAYVI